MHRVARHVLELEGDDSHVFREVAQRVEILIRRRDLAIGDLPRRRVLVGRKRMNAVSHAASGDGEHPAELTAPEHAERRARRNDLPPGQGAGPRRGGNHGNRSCRTFSV